MSAYTNSIKFWESFQKVQEELKKCLSLKKYERLNELVEGLDEEVYSYTGAHFFVENLYDEFFHHFRKKLYRQKCKSKISLILWQIFMCFIKL